MFKLYKLVSKIFKIDKNKTYETMNRSVTFSWFLEGCEAICNKLRISSIVNFQLLKTLKWCLNSKACQRILTDTLITFRELLSVCVIFLKYHIKTIQDGLLWFICYTWFRGGHSFKYSKWNSENGNNNYLILITYTF